MRVLCSAYACQPGKGSEPGIGWNVVTALSRWHDIWVLTRANNRAEIERAMARNPHPGLEFVYYDLPARYRRWKRGARGIRAYYRLWQHGAGRVGEDLHRRIRFEAAQHLTFGQYWSPSFLARLSIPYAWGPVGGAEVFPRSLYAATSPRAMLSSEIRRAFPVWAERQPSVRRTARNASLSLACTPETATRLRAMGARRIELFSAVGLNSEDLEAIGSVAARADGTGPIRFLSVTRLLGTKGVELGIRAFLAADIPGARYDVVGEGPDRARLERLVSAADAADRVRFEGWLPREATLNRYSSADVLVHLSPAESGGFVCLEAMAAGLPVLHLAAGGPAVVVPEAAGIRLELGTTDQVVERAVAAMQRLAADVGLRQRLGLAGRRYAESMGTWDARAGRLAEYLAEVAESA
jgi:glycosyltransferase involved in cell wall biosynthesis